MMETIIGPEAGTTPLDMVVLMKKSETVDLINYTNPATKGFIT